MAGVEEPAGGTQRLDIPGAARLVGMLAADAGGENIGARLIGDYTVMEEVGRGSTGAVYRARGDGKERALALKLFHEPLNGAQADRVWRELHVLEALALPVLPRLIDYGMHEGRLFLVTDYIEGAELREHCEGAGLGLRERAALMARVAEATQLLHDYGVIHRDIKPANVRITPSGGVMLLDLGLAAIEAGDPVATLTAEGQPLGTPAYMAPEQARGDRAALSIRADVWGLGATAWKVMLGATPFDLEGLTLHAAVGRIGGEEPRRPREVEPAAPKGLAAVLARACERRPERRYASARELAEDLGRWSRGEAVQAGEVGIFTRGLRWAGKHPLLATGAGCGAMVASTLMLTWASVWWIGQRPHTLEWDPSQDTARLVARSGGLIHEWPVQGRGAFKFCALTPEPVASVGDRLVILGTTGEEGPGLRVFRAGDPIHELWHGQFNEAPMFPTGKNGPAFGVRAGQLADVFPEVPGPELVVAEADHAGGSGVVRVYELGTGKVLFEAWHPGWLYGVRWLPRPRKLLLCGVNSELHWKERGFTDTETVKLPPWPAVVFAIEPRMGVTRARIETPGCEEKREIPKEWYRCVLPPEGAPKQSGLTLLAPTVGYGDSATHATFGVGSVWFVLNGAGEWTKHLMASETQRPEEELGTMREMRLGEMPAWETKKK